MPGIACPTSPLLTTAEAESVLRMLLLGGGGGVERKLDRSLLRERRFPLLPIRNQPAQQIAPASSSSSSSSRRIHAKTGASVHSYDSENDLAAMVHDFMENGGDDYDSGDTQSMAPTGFALLIDRLKAAAATNSAAEKELRGVIVRAVVSLPEDGVCSSGIDCKSRCIRSSLVQRLRAAGYDVALCKSQWQSVGRVPGGEYEFIDVETGSSEGRVIVDLDFRSQFEIARPIPQYKAALRLLPGLFIGSSRKLKTIVEIMSEAAKLSLRQNAMHLPPWRSLHYLSSKWLSPSYQRELADNLVSSGRSRSDVRDGGGDGSSTISALDRTGCCWQLKRTKACLMLDLRVNTAAGQQFSVHSHSHSHSHARS